MVMVPKTFRYEVSPSGVAAITLNRPDTLNSLTFEVYEELSETFRQLDTEPGVRAVTITGEGRAFCSGGDQHAIIADLMKRDMQGLLNFTRITGALIRNMRACRRPIVAAVNGTAVGAGSVIAIASDFRIVSEKAKFGFIFPRVGLCGADMGAAFLLPRLIGLSKASELLFFGDLVNASEALALGLANRMVKPEDCVSTARSWAERLANGPAFAHAMTKQMLNAEDTMTLDQAIEAEAQAQAICMMHPDFRTAHHGWTQKTEFKFEGAAETFKVGL
jgi:enoyl-CoA hydratase/carnithine racemase